MPLRHLVSAEQLRRSFSTSNLLEDVGRANHQLVLLPQIPSLSRGPPSPSSRDIFSQALAPLKANNLLLNSQSTHI